MIKENLKSIFIQNKPFTTEEAANTLHLSKEKTAKILYKYKKQGHLLKLKKGIYLPVPHKALTPEESFSNPNIIVPIIFPESYIGGWSASSYWGLTDQLFQTTCLITKKKFHHKTVYIGRFEYMLFSNFASNTLGKENIWVDQIQAPISDIHKTVIDMLENPKCGAGIQHTIDCLKVYFNEYYNEQIFISYINYIKNKVFFKRLGYITEILFGINHSLCELSKNYITKGDSLIDSSLNCNKLITRWHLYVSEGIVI